MVCFFFLVLCVIAMLSGAGTCTLYLKPTAKSLVIGLGAVASVILVFLLMFPEHTDWWQVIKKIKKNWTGIKLLMLFRCYFVRLLLLCVCVGVCVLWWVFFFYGL